MRTMLIVLLWFPVATQAQTVETTGDASPVGIVQGDGDVTITIRQGTSQGWLRGEIERLHESGDVAADEESRRELEQLLQLAQLIEDRNDALARTLRNVTHEATREALSEALQQPLSAPTVSGLMEALNTHTRELLTEARTSVRQEQTARYGIFAGIVGVSSFAVSAYYHVRLRHNENRLRNTSQTAPGYLATLHNAQRNYRRSMSFSALALSANITASTLALHPRAASRPRWFTWLLLGTGTLLSIAAAALYGVRDYSHGIPNHTAPMLASSGALPLLTGALFHFIARQQAQSIHRDRDVSSTSNHGGTSVPLRVH